MKPPFHLIPKELSHDTIKCAAQLYADAKKGELIGLAYGAMYRGRETVTGTTGECHRSRIFARGLIHDLDDRLNSIETETE